MFLKNRLIKALIYLKNKNNSKELKNRLDVFENCFSDKTYVDCLNIHEIENDLEGEYARDFEMVGYMLAGEVEQKFHI